MKANNLSKAPSTLFCILKLCRRFLSNNKLVALTYEKIDKDSFN